eukprot:m.100454 g.100454  ORF g.100454 m.100454 type:complete len:1120 (-) comp15400_c0_seq2:5-3364(-)
MAATTQVAVGALVLMVAAASATPVDHHVGVWSNPPNHCPSRMVTDAPLLGNGDMGAALCGFEAGGLTYFLGKMDFWTQTSGPNARADIRHLFAHVAAGHVTLKWANETATLTDMAAHQVLRTATVKASAAYNGATLQVSSIVGAEENLLLVRVKASQAVTLNVSLAATNMWDLPIAAGVAPQAEGAVALTLAREANAWINSATVLTECDEDMIVTAGLRGLEIDASTRRVRWVNATGLPVCPMRLDHPIFGNQTLGSGPCTASTKWVFAADGTVRQTVSGSDRCAAYPTASPLQPLQVQPCASPEQGWGTVWTEVKNVSLPEGGTTMLRARDLNSTSSWGGATACNASCPAGQACCIWQHDGGCMTAVKPNLNISMGLAAMLTSKLGGALKPLAAHVDSQLASSASFSLTPGVEYMLRVAARSTRPGKPAKTTSALADAVALAATPDVARIVTHHTDWWSKWWNASSIDLGPERQVLESFYYGAQYMLGCFSRPGGVTAGLFGPWSLQDPVGWSDHLTLDYNVEANFFGAPTANRLSSMLPYFATMDSLVPECRKRAKLATWSHGGHASFGTWGQMSEMIGCGPTSFSVMGNCGTNMGGYDGIECPSAMGAFAELTVGHDSSVRFVAALMAVPYIEYYEFSQDLAFLNEHAFPFVSAAADFYASYATPVGNGTYNLLWTCAQEICSQRQAHASYVNHNSVIDLAHAGMVLRKAAEWAPLLNDPGLETKRLRWLDVAHGLPPFPITSDSDTLPHGPDGNKFFGNRTVWSESLIKHTSVNTSIWGGTCQGFSDFFDTHVGVDWGCCDWAQWQWWVTTQCNTNPKATVHLGCALVTPINCSVNDPCQNGGVCIDNSTVKGWNYGVCHCPEGWSGRLCDKSAQQVVEPAEFPTNYMYPIVHFAPMHPTSLVGLRSDVFSGNDTAAHAKVLQRAINTVWGDNERSQWHPVNGLCLAWPAATRVTDGAVPSHAASLLDRYEAALNATMQPNFWPSMSGGGLEQVGATVAVDELLLQSHEGYLALFPAWGKGLSASFITLRARGAFLVSAQISADRVVASPVEVVSEAGARCRLLSPWVAGETPVVTKVQADGSAAPVAVWAEAVRGVAVWAWDTTKGASYMVNEG